jgi:hypothetical protein
VQSPISKIFLLNILIMAGSVVHAIEVKPFKFIKNNEGYPENIALYKITNKYSELYVKKYPFSIENSNRNSGFISEIDPQCETLEKIYKQQQNTYVVTSTCGAWFGMSSPENHYFIYEFNDVSKLIKSETIEFKESLDITLSELNSGIKITSTQSPTTGKKYNFEYKNGNLYDFSTSMNRNLVSKESDRVCKGFYDQVYTEFKYSYVPGMNNLFEILPRHAYSWVPNKIKFSEELSDKLANDLKGKDLTQRRSVPYSRFKQDYCS